VSGKEIRNLPASVLARLLQQAKRTGEDYQVLLSRFVGERFLYRLGASSARDRFVLKGAMLLRIFTALPYRATRDVDLLRRGAGTAEDIRSDIERICATEVKPDGIDYDLSTIRIEPIRPEDEYSGIRATLVARCGRALVPLQIDVGVADDVWPPPAKRIVPALLDFPKPEVLVYSWESVIAEKLEALVVLGDRNSRIKDFFDVRHLAERHAFDRAVLAGAVRRTFEGRGTPVPEGDPIGLTAAYWENPSRPAQIRAFARRACVEVSPDIGNEILQILRLFLLPLLDDLRAGLSKAGHWVPGGPWQ